MSEKFCLRWNDFQTTTSKSFGKMRQDEDFFDVTLVSDDQVQVSAHKLVLSACSSFFKTILKANPHSHPLLYLSGINSTNLNYILDYVYHGEVQLYQENLEAFLDTAQKLDIEGLTSDLDSKEVDDSREENSYVNSPKDKPSEIKHKSFSNPIVKTASILNGDPEEVKMKVKEMIIKNSDGTLNCSTCDKVGTDIRNMQRHVELHIEGISYNCSHCDQTFRSKNALNLHLSRKH